MTKRLTILLVVSLTVLIAHAQEWTAKDSLKLNRLLNGKEELKLNLEAVKSIDLSTAVGTPQISEQKEWMLPDETLPLALPNKKKVILTLRPYNVHTKYNWDPIYQRKIKVSQDTYKINLTESKYANWAKTPMSGGTRGSWEEIKASGVRYNMFSERVNNRMVSTTTIDPSMGLSLGNGATVSGGTIGGLNLMRIFEKDFWDKAGRERKERTLEVLKQYGDSTTVLINHAIIQPIIR